VGLCGDEADGGDLGLGEHDPGDGGVVGAAGLAEDGVGDHAGLVHRDVGEQRDAGDVAERPQPVGCPAVLVALHPAARVRRDADVR